MGYSKFRLEKGDAIQIGELFYEILGEGAASVKLRTLDGRSIQDVSHAEMFELYFRGELRVRRALLGNLPEVVVENLHKPLESFSLCWQEEALLRLQYVQMCDRIFSPEKRNRRGRFPKRPEGYSRISKLVSKLRRRSAAQLAGVSVFTCKLETYGGSTVREWHTRWVDSGRSLVALVPGHDSKGHPGMRLAPEVIKIVGDRIRSNYLTTERPDATYVHHLVCADIDKLNEKRPNPAAPSFRTPSYDTFLRYIELFVEPYDRVLHREGAKVAANQFRRVKRTAASLRPLDVVEVDHTPLDLILVDDNGTPSRGDKRKREQYKAWLTLARCRRTKMVWGFHISREPPSWLSVMACARMGVLPKDLSTADVRSPWPIFGVPEVVVMDNGTEFHSNSLEAAAGQLRFEPRWMPRGRPHQKGGIERTLGIVAREFLATMPGKTFSNPVKRGDYDSQGRAGITIEKLRDLFTVYVVDVLHNKPMGVLLGKTPLQALEDSAGFSFRLPPSVEDLGAILALTIDRTVTSRGVTFLGLTYHSQSLHNLRKTLGHLGKKLMVKVDPLDLGQVMVLDPGEGTRKAAWLQVECKNPELADHVPLVVWKEAIAIGRQHVAEGQRIPLSILRDALRRITDEAMSLGKKPRRAVQEDLDWATSHVDDPVFDVAPDGGRDATGLFEEERQRKRGRPRKPAGKPTRRVGHSGPSVPAEGESSAAVEPIPVGDENSSPTEPERAPATPSPPGTTPPDASAARRDSFDPAWDANPESWDEGR